MYKIKAGTPFFLLKHNNNITSWENCGKKSTTFELTTLRVRNLFFLFYKGNKKKKLVITVFYKGKERNIFAKLLFRKTTLHEIFFLFFHLQLNIIMSFFRGEIFFKMNCCKLTSLRAVLLLNIIQPLKTLTYNNSS